MNTEFLTNTSIIDIQNSSKHIVDGVSLDKSKEDKYRLKNA